MDKRILELRALAPETNCSIQALLFVIEVGLRELVIAELSTRYGEKWWKSRLPSDVQEKYKGARESQRKVKWSQLVPHHPLYYIDFPDLDKVITKADNWRDVFQDIFANAEVFKGYLRGLEPIRNAVAHNRKTSDADLTIVLAALEAAVSAIGAQRIESLVSNCTTAPNILEMLTSLFSEAQIQYGLCTHCLPLTELTVWETVRRSWWYDTEYLLDDVDPISELFDLLGCYQALPRLRGRGYKVEQWLGSVRIDEVWVGAKAAFTTVLSSL